MRIPYTRFWPRVLTLEQSRHYALVIVANGLAVPRLLVMHGLDVSRQRNFPVPDDQSLHGIETDVCQRESFTQLAKAASDAGKSLKREEVESPRKLLLMHKEREQQ